LKVIRKNADKLEARSRLTALGIDLHP